MQFISHHTPDSISDEADEVKREVFVELPHVSIRHTSVGYSDGFSVVDEIRLGWLIVVFNRRDLLGSFILEGTQSPV